MSHYHKLAAPKAAALKAMSEKLPDFGTTIFPNHDHGLSVKRLRLLRSRFSILAIFRIARAVPYYCCYAVQITAQHGSIAAPALGQR